MADFRDLPQPGFVLAKRPAARHLNPMTASQVIDEIERLPEAERQAVFQRVHELEESLIPESFITGMAEAEAGNLIDIEDHHFDQPPA